MIVCSFGVNDHHVLVGNPDYPEIATDCLAHVAAEQRRFTAMLRAQQEAAR